MKKSFSPQPAVLIPMIVLALAPLLQAAPSSSPRNFRPVTAKAVRLAPSPQVMPQGQVAVATREGWAHFDRGEWEKAMDCFLTALERDPRHASAAEGLTMAVYRSGDYRSAAQLGEEFALAMPWIREMVAEAILVEAKQGVEKGEVSSLRELVAALPHGGGAYDSVRILVESASLERIETARNAVAQAAE